MEEATKAAIDKDGWLHTGDLAIMDENGYCKITGRLKDMIIRGGENIYPREIEEFMYTHPAVKDVQVIGVPDQKYGEEVFAYVILKDDIEEIPTEEEMVQFVKNGLSRFKAPRYIRYIDNYPMTANGKIQKFKLRQIAIEELGLQEIASVETA
jgi:AMP-binding enzyme.